MYIPLDWFKNAENENEIRDLLREQGGCFRFDEDSDSKKIESRLKELGEDKIFEEWKKGTFAI